MALTEIQLKYVGFMAPLAKKVPDPCIRSKSQHLSLGPNVSLGQLFLQHIFLSLSFILWKLQQQIVICFCTLSSNFVRTVFFLRFLTY